MKIFGGLFKGKTLKTPNVRGTRPTKAMVREAFFNICQHEISDALFLDLFAGSGSMGFEALSRGARSVVFVEQERRASQCIADNIKALQVQTRAELIPSNVFSALEHLEQRNASFTLIYIDPPYEQVPELGPRLLSELNTKNLVTPRGIIFLEGPSIGTPLTCFSQQRTYGSSRLYWTMLS